MTSEKLWSNIKWLITAIVIPGTSALIWFVYWLAQMSGDVNTLKQNQMEHIADFKDFKMDATKQLTAISERLDTVERRQHDNKRDIDYKLMALGRN